MSIPVTVRFTVDAPDMDTLRRRAHHRQLRGTERRFTTWEGE